MLRTYGTIDEGIPQKLNLRTEAQQRHLKMTNAGRNMPCPNSVFSSFAWFSQQTAIDSLESINQLISVMETQCYFSEVGSLEDANEFRTRLLNVIGALSKASVVKAWIYDTVTYYMECDYRRGLDWWVDLLTTLTTQNYTTTATPYNS
jgi:hypothetical protein